MNDYFNQRTTKIIIWKDQSQVDKEEEHSKSAAESAAEDEEMIMKDDEDTSQTGSNEYDIPKMSKHTRISEKKKRK